MPPVAVSSMYAAKTIAPAGPPARPRTILSLVSVYSRMLVPLSVSSPLSTPSSGAPVLPTKLILVMVAPGAALTVNASLPVLPTAPV
ncbi:hypothetical protein D3C85_1734270 [compost metagenome]